MTNAKNFSQMNYQKGYEQGYADAKAEYESMLDKITVELKSVKEKWWYGVDDDCFMKLSDVLQIIDKYKTESEE